MRLIHLLAAAIVYICFCLPLTTYAQTCVPNTPAVGNAPIAAATIASLIKTNGGAALKTQTDWENQRNALTQCNTATNTALREVEDKMSQLSLQRQEVLAVKDVANLQQQLIDLHKSREESREELRKNLAQIKMAGLYVSILTNIDPLTAKPTLIRQSENAIAPQAARDLGGTYIQRETRVSNASSVSDIIRSFSSGSMTIGEMLKDQPMNASKKFVYAAKVYVSPAKTLPALSGATADGNNALVFAISSSNTPEMALATSGLPQNIIDDLSSILSAKIATVESENAAASKKAREIAVSGESKIAAISQQISGIEAQIDVAKNKVRDVLASLGYTFDANDLKGSINRAIVGMNTQAATLAKQWLDTKAKEMLWKESSVLPEGEPADAIGKTASDLAGQLDKSYGRITTSAEVMEIINLSVTGYQEGRSVEVFRSLERVWTIGIPQDDGSFRVVSIGKFKVNSKVGTGDCKDCQPPVDTTRKKIPPAGNYTERGTGVPFDMVAIPGNSPTGKPFFMAKYEVTVREYFAFCTETNSHWPEWLEVGSTYNIETGSDSHYKNKGYARTGADNLPIMGVSWHDAVAYCEWLSKKTGTTYRLPTEAEWEYAAKGGQDYEYAGSNNIDAVAWYTENSGGRPHAVGGKQANGYGLYDMSGNVWEWCSDLWDSSSSLRVLRGGSWRGYPQYCRVAYRYNGSPTLRGNYLGFRVVRLL